MWNNYWFEFYARLFCVVALPFFSCFCSWQVAVALIINLSADDETRNVLKRPVKMLAHVLALCFILRLVKRSSHYAPNFKFRISYTFFIHFDAANSSLVTTSATLFLFRLHFIENLFRLHIIENFDIYREIYSLQFIEKFVYKLYGVIYFVYIL